MSFALFGFGRRPSSPRGTGARRRFQPSLSPSEGVLESRLVLSTASAPSAIVSARAANKNVPVSTWNNQAAWTFINGRWNSTTTSPILRGFIGRALRLKSVDTWAATSASVSLTQASNFDVGTLRIEFQSSGTPRLVLQTDPDSPAVTISASAATRNSVTFKGKAPATLTLNGQDVNTAETTLTVTVTKLSNRTMQIRFFLGDGARPLAVLAYNAAKK